MTIRKIISKSFLFHVLFLPPIVTLSNVFRTYDTISTVFCVQAECPLCREQFGLSRLILLQNYDTVWGRLMSFSKSKTLQLLMEVAWTLQLSPNFPNYVHNLDQYTTGACRGTLWTPSNIVLCNVHYRGVDKENTNRASHTMRYGRWTIRCAFKCFNIEITVYVVALPMQGIYIYLKA